MSQRACLIFLTLLYAGCPKDTTVHQQSDEGVKAQLLNRMLAASNDHDFDTALRAHGSIQGAEVPYVIKALQTSGKIKQRNAALLLRLAHTSESAAELRKQILETSDLKVWAIALGTTLDSPEAKALSAKRPDFIKAALKDQDAGIVGVGLRAAVLTGYPGIEEELDRHLSSSNAEERLAVADALAQAGAGPLEAKVRARALLEKDSRVHVALIAALSKSDDPSTAKILRQALETADDDMKNDFWNGTVDSEKPWLRALVLELAQQEGPHRSAAIDRLVERGLDADGVKICAEIFEKTPPKGEPNHAQYYVLQEHCMDGLSKLAGRRVERSESLKYARAWLAQNQRQKTP